MQACECDYCLAAKQEREAAPYHDGRGQAVFDALLAIQRRMYDLGVRAVVGHCSSRFLEQVFRQCANAPEIRFGTGQASLATPFGMLLLQEYPDVRSHLDNEAPSIEFYNAACEFCGVLAVDE